MKVYQLMFWEKEISGETIRKAKQRFRERIGVFPDFIISELRLSEICPELKQKYQKLPKGHFILGNEN